MKRRLLVYFGVIGGLAVLNFGGPSGCGTSAKCGDGFVSGDEVCDGSALNGQTCESQGFSSEGTLKCAADCKSFDTSSCQKPGTLSGLSDISGDSDDSAFLIGDGLGNAYTTIHFKSTTLMAGGKSLANVTPGTGIPRGAAGKVNDDGTFAWLLGFQSNSTPFGDNGASFVFDASGNVFFTGDFEGTQQVGPDRTLINTDPTGTTSDAYAGRLNADGTVAWLTMFTSSKNDQIFMRFDPAGNLYVTGQFQGPTMTADGKTFTNIDSSGNTYDKFIAKMNPDDGTLVWATTFGSNNNDDLFETVNASGILLVRGDFSGTKLVVNGTDELTNAAPGTPDAFVGRLDPSTGNLMWITGFSSNQSDFISVAEDPAGHAFASGGFTGPTLTAGGKTLTNADGSGTTQDAFAARLNEADGSVTWLVPFSSNKSDLAQVVTDSLGDVYIGGSFFGATLTASDKSLTNADASGTTLDNFLGKINPSDGTMAWLTGFSGPGSSGGVFGSFLPFVDAAGNVYGVGGFNGATITIAGKTLTNADPSGSTNDAFIARFTPDGTLAWITDFSGDGNDFAELATDFSDNVPSKEIFVSGSTQSKTFTAGGQTLTNADTTGATNDAFAGKLDPATGNFSWFVPFSSSGDDNASLFPDASGKLFVTVGFTGPSITVQGQTFTNADPSGTTQDTFAGAIAP